MLKAEKKTKKIPGAAAFQFAIPIGAADEGALPKIDFRPGKRLKKGEARQLEPGA